MDRMLYVAMAGAKETLRAQTVNNHNLANASTTGFKADLAAFQSRAVDGSGYASRVYTQSTTNGWDATSGSLLTTGRDLDVAVNGTGWIAVQGARWQGSVHARRRSAARCHGPAHDGHRSPGDRRRRPDQSFRRTPRFSSRGDGSISIVGAGSDARRPRRRSAA